MKKILIVFNDKELEDKLSSQNKNQAVTRAHETPREPFCKGLRSLPSSGTQCRAMPTTPCFPEGKSNSTSSLRS